MKKSIITKDSPIYIDFKLWTDVWTIIRHHKCDHFERYGELIDREHYFIKNVIDYVDSFGSFELNDDSYNFDIVLAVHKEVIYSTKKGQQLLDLGMTPDGIFSGDLMYDILYKRDQDRKKRAYDDLQERYMIERIQNEERNRMYRLHDEALKMDAQFEQKKLDQANPPIQIADHVPEQHLVKKDEQQTNDEANSDFIFVQSKGFYRDNLLFRIKWNRHNSILTICAIGIIISFFVH